MKTILLTGPARGVGLAISKKLVNEGYCVVGVGRKLTPDFEKLVKGKFSGKAQFINYDLEKLEGIPELVNEVTKKYKRIYINLSNLEPT